MNTYTGAVQIFETSLPIDGTTFVPEGHVLIHGTEADMQRVGAAVRAGITAKERAERKARNKAAKKSRRANR